MCYGSQIASKARIAASELGLEYDEALKLIDDEYRRRWTTAFGRPSVPILVNDHHVLMSRWTFLGPWIKDEKQADFQVNKTGNARAEEMFDKATFKEAAVVRRGLLAVEGYYEHQHRDGGKVKIPFRFRRPDRSVFYIGVIYQDWNDYSTFAVCTMQPNALAAWVHNNPDAYTGPRQPVIFRTPSEARQWLQGGGPESIEHLIQVREDGFLVAQQCANVNGNWAKKVPEEPPGRPEGVLDPDENDP